MMLDFKLNSHHDVYLLRHGETEWNKEERIQGRLDSPLTEAGKAHAVRQGHTLQRIRKNIGPHTVFCSPLKRARATAKLALGSDDFVIDQRLSEIACGQWEGTTHDQRIAKDPDIEKKYTTEFDVYLNAPDGESLTQVAERIVCFINDLEGPAVIFSHKVVLVVMHALLCGLQEELHSGLAPPQGTILHIKNKQLRYHV